MLQGFLIVLYLVVLYLVRLLGSKHYEYLLCAGNLLRSEDTKWGGCATGVGMGSWQGLA